MKKIIAAHKHHPRQFQGTCVVYPVLSRRSGGISIGINLNADKLCNFNCAYCQVDRKIAGMADFSLGILAAELQKMLEMTIDGRLFDYAPFDESPPELRRLNDIAFSGDGEPTASPFFLDACQKVIEIKEKLALNDIKIIVITNSSMFNKPIVQQALALLDEHNGQIWAKLDAGDVDYYRLVNQSKIPFEKIKDNIILASRQRPIVIQTLMMNIDGQGPTAMQVQNYIDCLQDIIRQGGQILQIQLHTIARKPRQDNLSSLSNTQLDSIADIINANLKIPLSRHYGNYK